MGFQQNRNIKGELAQASVFVLLKGTTALTGFLGWRDEREGRVWGVLLHLVLLRLYLFFIFMLFLRLSLYHSQPPDYRFHSEIREKRTRLLAESSQGLVR